MIHAMPLCLTFFPQHKPRAQTDPSPRTCLLAGSGRPTLTTRVSEPREQCHLAARPSTASHAQPYHLVFGMRAAPRAQGAAWPARLGQHLASQWRGCYSATPISLEETAPGSVDSCSAGSTSGGASGLLSALSGFSHCDSPGRRQSGGQGHRQRKKRMTLNGIPRGRHQL